MGRRCSYDRVNSLVEETGSSTGESEDGEEALGLRRENRAELPFGRVGC